MKNIAKYIKVVFPIPTNKAFCYSIPDSLQRQVGIGTRVLAPFGNRDSVGFVVGKIGKPEIQNIKDIKKILDAEPLISPSLFEIVKWMAGYYVCSLGEALDTVLSHRFHPVKIRKKKSQKPHQVKFYQPISPCPNRRIF